MAANRKMTMTMLLAASSYPLWHKVLPESYSDVVGYNKVGVFSHGKTVGKRDKTAKNSTSGYAGCAAKLNFELYRGMADKMGHAAIRGRSAMCMHPRAEKQ